MLLFQPERPSKPRVIIYKDRHWSFIFIIISIAISSYYLTIVLQTSRQNYSPFHSAPSNPKVPPRQHAFFSYCWKPHCGSFCTEFGPCRWLPCPPQPLQGFGNKAGWLCQPWQHWYGGIRHSRRYGALRRFSGTTLLLRNFGPISRWVLFVRKRLSIRCNWFVTPHLFSCSDYGPSESSEQIPVRERAANRN